MDSIKWIKKVLYHKLLVFFAGRKMRVSFWQLIKHDLSKLSRTEFAPARDKFIGGKDSYGFSAAMRNHFSKNRHHWQHWAVGDQMPQPMPEEDVREMVADWMATGYEKEKSWNIKKWFLENYPSMRLHQETDKIMDKVMEEDPLTRKQRREKKFWDENPMAL